MYIWYTNVNEILRLNLVMVKNIAHKVKLTYHDDNPPPVWDIISDKNRNIDILQIFLEIINPRSMISMNVYGIIMYFQRVRN